MIALVAGLFFLPAFASPPFHLAWSWPKEMFGSTLGVSGSLYVFENRGSLYGVDLATKKTVWKRAWSSPGVILDCPSDQGRIFYGVMSPLDRSRRPLKHTTKGALVQIDLKTGKTLLYLSADIDGGCAVSGKVAYFVDSAKRIQAVDLGTDKRLWSASLKTSEMIYETSSLVVTPHTVVVELEGDIRKGGWVVGVDRATGKFRWKHDSSGERMGLPRYVGQTLVIQDAVLRGLDPDTGVARWKIDTAETCVSTTIVEGKLICCFSRTLFELDPTQGEVLWRYRLRSDDDFDLPIEVVRAGPVLLVSESPFAALTLGGEELWRSKEIEGHAIWSNGSRIVTNGLNGLFAYDPGAPPAIPTLATAKRKRAIELCRNLRGLDPRGMEDLIKLGEQAFEPLLRASISLAEDFNRHHTPGDDQILDELPGMLAKVVTVRQIPQIVRGVRSHPVNEWVGMVLLPALLMAKSGSETEDVSVCLWVLSKQKPTAWPGDESSMALSFLRACSDPRAKKYVKDWDRKHPPRNRNGRKNDD